MERYEEYAQIKDQINELQDTAKSIENELFLDMANKEEKTVRLKFGTFSIAKKDRWKYTEELQERIKIIKKKEEEDGRAIRVSISYLMFRKNNK